VSFFRTINLVGDILILVLLAALYLLPSTIAFYRRHPQRFPIVILNVLGGMTGILWVCALAWSVLNFDNEASDGGQELSNG
jgi:hypothetical protein